MKLSSCFPLFPLSGILLFTSCTNNEEAFLEEIDHLEGRVHKLEGSLNKLRNERDHYANQYKQYRERAIVAEVTLKELQLSDSSADDASQKEAALKALKEERELRRIKGLVDEQQALLDTFIGTEFKSLKTNSGKEYLSAKVVSASPIDIGIMHQSGKVTLTYDALPEEISEQIGYNEETAEYEIKRRAEEAKGKSSSSLRSSTGSRSQVASNSQPRTITRSTSGPTEETADPKGVISTKVTRTYNQGGKTYKDIVVMARSNVHARLVVNSEKIITIAPNVTQSHDVISKPGGDFSVQLVTYSGTVLDSKVIAKRKIGL